MDVSGSLEVRWVQGFTSSRVALLDEKIACFPCGNYITFLNVETKQRDVLQSPGHGIGAFIANGCSKILAFSEHKCFPSIFVYTYPELSLRCELKGSAKLAYTALAVSDTDPYLASCSSSPDYTITVWNLEEGISICSSQLAEEDVTTLLFHPLNWQQICAVNAKSLTVWNIERSKDVHVMEPSVIALPDTDGSVVEQEVNTSYILSGKLTFSGPQMPTSAIAGMIGDKADKILPLMRVKPRLSPSAICWSGSSDLYVGTKEGFLLLVNTESLIVSILYNPIKQSTSDCIQSLVIQEGNFQSLALHIKGLFATGHDGVLQTLKIKDHQVEIVETLNLVEPVSSLCFSPDCETLLLSSNTGCIYRYNPGLKNDVIKVLDVLCGDFVMAVPVYTENNLCVSVRESGKLQLWSLENGDCIVSVSLQTKVTCLACCPISQYVAVGTVMGHILFVDLTRAEKPRLVHTVHLYHLPVEHLVFDQGGNFLFAGAFDSHIFLLDARPSKAFEIIGYTDTMESIVSLSTQYQMDNKQVDVLILCNSEKQKKKKNRTAKEHKEGNMLMLLSLSTKILDTANGVDRHGHLRDEVIQTCVYKIPHFLSSCVLATKAIFGYCHQKKVLQRFPLPQSVDMSSNQKEVALHADKEVEGHPLGPVSLCLSPHQSWLASVGRDGLLRIYDSSSLEMYVQNQCHSWWLGGIRSVSFSPDSQTLITTGSTLVCSQLGMAATTQCGLSMMASSEDKMSQENLILSDMASWKPPSQTQVEASNSDQAKDEIPDKQECCSSLSYTTPCSSTWLDDKINTVLKEESQQFAETQISLKKSTDELQYMIQAMMQENEKLPDMEKLEHLEFNLDMEEQQKLETEGEQEVTKVRKEIELENLSKHYLHCILKKKYWDSINVKGKAIKAFHSVNKVDNFLMMENTAKELEQLHRAEATQKTEQANINLPQGILENIKAPLVRDEEEENGHEVESPALTGSLTVLYGGSNLPLYSQFSLRTRDQKIKQILLIQGIIYQVKTAFNKEFEVLFKHKEQEIRRIRERNKRIREIMSELKLQETLWEPSLSDEERPERVFTVSDSEIKVEKYLTPELRQREEDQKKEEEQRRLGVKEDNTRERGLDHMMGGILEVKKEDILKMEVPPPEFIDKPESEWTEEERKTYKEYERKVKELSDEQEKYRMSLDAEMKKLQESIKDITQAFDQTLNKLYDKKVKTEIALYQEELKITNLLRSLLTEEEMLNTEEELVYRLKKALAVKNQIGKTLNNYREDVKAFQDSYDNTVAEDKLLDGGFRKVFSDVPGPMVDQLYKLYKRRPRIQLMRTQTDKTGSLQESPVLSQAEVKWHSEMMKAMEELDAPQNKPEGLDRAVWERFCLARRSKVECEQKVKVKAMMLAEMQAFLQKRINEQENAQTEINNLNDNINCLREERTRFCLNVIVQILLKQGQVEVDSEDFTADYSDSLLLPRSVVEDLNNTIRVLTEQKIASMVESKDFRKGIIQQEWEHKRLSRQIEDLKNKARDIQMLHVSREVQEYLTDTDPDSRMSKKEYSLEKTIMLQEKTCLKNIECCKKIIKDLNRQVEVKKKNIAALDMQLVDMQSTVAERRSIYESAALERNHAREAKQRYQNIVKRKKLVDLAKAQAMEIAVLSRELEYRRMKTFPALFQ